MADRLGTYRAKRDFDETSEPAGEATPAADRARFVIQEHHATRLHWDLRLEHDGVLASWAIPNGLPEEPKDNRLAVRTEDHPLEYLEFHGEIPKGSYGAGTMRIWDRGTYEELKWEPRKVEVALHGERLEGRYALFPLDNGEQPKDWMIHRMDPPADPAREPMPDKIVPMMARAGALPPDTERWAHEIKWDGVRAIAHSEPGRLHFQSRNLHDITPRYPELSKLNRALSHHRAILDGEIVALDAEGRPSFGALQRRMHLASESAVRRLAKEAPVTYLIFDLLWLDGHSLMGLPYEERRARLDDLELSGPRWRVSDYVAGNGPAMARATAEQGLEGVVAKGLDAPYEPGRRSPCWVKVKHVDRQEVVVGGWMPGEGRRRERIGALLVGVRDDGHLRYAGRVGTGFTESELDRLGALLQPIERPKSPFDAPVQPKPPRGAVWVEPRYVAEVEFREWTQGGQLRAPSYKGLRDDKAPEEVVAEGGPAVVVVEEKSKATATVEGREVKVSNLDKVLYPAVGFTKRDVIEFYADIAPVLLPHLEGRPLTLKRYPNGVEGKFFYEKNAPSHRPEWVHTEPVELDRKTIPFVVCDDLPTLVWLANLADLELHTLLAPADPIERRNPPRPGAAYVAPPPRRHRASPRLCFRSRPGRAGDDRRVLPGRPAARGHVPRAGPAELPEDVGLEGPAGLRAAQLRRDVRRDEAVRQGGRRAARARGAGPRRLAPDEDAAPRQGPRRLEPERRAQDDGERVLAARARPADGLDSADVGRGPRGRAVGRPRAPRVRRRRGAGARGRAGRPLRARRVACAAASRGLTSRLPCPGAIARCASSSRSSGSRPTRPAKRAPRSAWRRCSTRPAARAAGAASARRPRSRPSAAAGRTLSRRRTARRCPRRVCSRAARTGGCSSGWRGRCRAGPR